MKTHLQGLLRSALDAVLSQAGVTAAPVILVDATKDEKFGDFQTNLALQIGKALGKPPRAAAELLVQHLPPSPSVSKVEIAGPGFINFFLNRAVFQNVVADILTLGEVYGHDTSGARGRVMVEFVSANPTGPMHVGHGRGAAYGDALSNLLAAAGYTVWREYYINDAGRQVDVLAVSVLLRYLELHQHTLAFPKRGYPAPYVSRTAEKLKARHGGEFASLSLVNGLKALPAEVQAADSASEQEQEAAKARQEERLDQLITLAKAQLPGYQTIKHFALEDQLGVIRSTLQDFKVRFDDWKSEQALVDSGFVRHALDTLKAKGLTYEKDGAIWMSTEKFGDEKDRVLFKADGAATYFCNDLAYHIDKLERGWTMLINAWGADHHGYIGRVRAAIEAITGRKDALKVQLIQFVTLSSGRMGKRSGNFVTLQDLLDEAGADATRFFYLIRAHEQHLEFDIDLARSKSNENPVFYVQYAHARICSVFAQLKDKAGVYDRAAGLAALARLDNEHEKRLLTALTRYPEVIRNAAANHAPHALAFYLKDELADALHSYYNAHKFLGDDAALQNARLALIEATRVVLASGLGLLGVSAPESM